MKKDLIEIVTEDRNYCVKGDYEVVKTDLIKYAGENGWAEFDELTEGTDIDKLLLRVGSIIAIHKLYEWSWES